MRTFLTVLILTVATQAGAECGKLCDGDWWMRATVSDVHAELNAGADVMARKEDGSTPLHYAPATRTPANIQALLDAGADVMARDHDGWTPLHYAASGTSTNIQALLDAGADVMALTMAGITPLHLAAMFSKPAQIHALLAAGADTKAKGKDGNTPWDYAQANERLKGTEAYRALKDAHYN